MILTLMWGGCFAPQETLPKSLMHDEVFMSQCMEFREASDKEKRFELAMEIRTSLMNFVGKGGRIPISSLVSLLGFPSVHIGNEIVYDFSIRPSEVRMLMVTSRDSRFVSEVDIVEGDR